MENTVRHAGVIESIDGSHLRVRILQESACTGCKVASHCTTSQAKEKVVDVTADGDYARWQVGDEVVVTTQASMAGKALFIGFGFPLVLMLVVLAVASVAGCCEGAAAVYTLGSLLPYYLLVWLFREKIARQISFRIE